MRTLAVIVTLALAQMSLPADEKTPVAIGDWSEPVDGLRGRLLVFQGPVRDEGTSRETLVYVELQNVAASGERDVYFEPSGLKCELRDVAGKGPPRPKMGSSGSGGRPGKKWVRLPHDSSLRLRVSPYGYGSPDEKAFVITIGFDTWQIKATDAAEYSLAGTFKVNPPEVKGREKSWAGELKLPAAKVVWPPERQPTSGPRARPE